SITCGYPLDVQLDLRDDVEAEFDVPVLTVCNKADLSRDVEADRYMSATEGEGLDGVWPCPLDEGIFHALGDSIALVVIHVSVDVFITVNQYFTFAGMQLLSATVSFLGFLFLFAGVYRVWTVVYT
ncbi:MAG: hypothetical protein SVW77_02135, partial [Candidatus Nanohaloarchaea archaeon]|nr:hypothetical protein [Candidatus Nanohaloarchaea archaeon]